MKNIWVLFILQFFVNSTVFSFARAAADLKFGIITSNGPPLLHKFENQNMPIATGGFIYEVTVIIAEEINESYSIVSIPRGRIAQELVSGNTDLICHSSLHWDPPYKNDVHWSKPLFTYKNVLVGKKEIPFNSPDKIANITIGTVDNFVYPDLSERFKTGKLHRDNANSVDANMAKLLGDRLDYVIMSEIEYTFYKEKHPQLRRSPFPLNETEIRCTLSKKSSLSLERLNNSIDKLTANKSLQKSYDRYMNPKTTPRPLTYGLNNNDSPPFIFFNGDRENPRVQGGVFFKLALELGKHLKRPINFVLLPRSRINSGLAEGQVDLVCYNTEAWVGKYANSYYWSVPIFKQIDYIVSIRSLKDDFIVKSLKDLEGKTLGTTLNFVYPTLAPYFKQGKIIREDADSGTASVAKLNYRRVNYIVLNNLEYEYFKKKHPNLQKSPIDIDPTEVKCTISKKSDLKLAKINAVILEMKKSGKMQKVFEQ